MKCFKILVGLLSATAFSQNIFQQAQNCFDNGDYPCAENQYKSILNNADYKQQIKAEIKLIEVENIVKELKKAQDWIDDEYFTYAKGILQKINKINPRDPNVKNLINKCNQKNGPFLDTSPSYLTFHYKSAQPNQIKVKTNSKSWRVLEDRTPSWIVTAKKLDILSVSCKKNRKEKREGKIYIESSDGLRQVIKITQKGKR